MNAGSFRTGDLKLGPMPEPGVESAPYPESATLAVARRVIATELSNRETALGPERRGAASFDPHVGAEVLEHLAQLALTDRSRYAVLEPGDPMLIAAALLAEDAKLWLVEQLTPLDWFAGEAIWEAHTHASKVHLESFVSALRGAAMELVHVQHLVDHRSRARASR